MSFDNTCRRLAELYPSDFASWALRRKVKYPELSPTELSSELIRAAKIKARTDFTNHSERHYARICNLPNDSHHPSDP